MLLLTAYFSIFFAIMKDIDGTTGLSHIHFFEGVEKLLEIWFDDCNENGDNTADLRTISRDDWENLLKLVKCEIISFSRNNAIDAYVLSESSMFVSDRRWILKTCGTTTPLQCVKPLLALAKDIGFIEISDLFYSRKNFSRPELQSFPHRGFCEESEFLDELFPDGRSYLLGSINRECWYLYTFSKFYKTTNMRQVAAGHYPTSTAPDPDQTIEILMQDLDDDVMSTFNRNITALAEDATVKSGITTILPNMTIDDYLFDPCGYSMNGISKAGEYMTIHITPEKQFSYVSFESNVTLDSYSELINRVIKTFKPSKFLVTIFANKASESYKTMKDLELEYTQSSNWKRTDMQFCNFPSYNLLFAQYHQLPAKRLTHHDQPA